VWRYQLEHFIGRKDIDAKLFDWSCQQSGQSLVCFVFIFEPGFDQIAARRVITDANRRSWRRTDRTGVV
jgi:hypothetical protein